MAHYFLKEFSGCPLTAVEHIETDVDFGSSAGNTVFIQGQALGKPPDMIEPERAIQERQSDYGAVASQAWRCARHRDGQDRFTKAAEAVHSHSASTGGSTRDPGPGRLLLPRRERHQVEVARPELAGATRPMGSRHPPNMPVPGATHDDTAWTNQEVCHVIRSGKANRSMSVIATWQLVAVVA